MSDKPITSAEAARLGKRLADEATQEEVEREKELRRSRERALDHLHELQKRHRTA